MIALSAAVSCDWFDMDNQDGWDAKVEGKIIDTKTGEPVQTEQGSSITVIEKGWDAEDNQSWLVKNNGTYVNKLVFAGDYRMDTKNANFTCAPTEFSLKKGGNTVDFKVTPYARVLNPSVKFEGGKIIATCSVEAGMDAVNNIGEVVLCVYPDRFVRKGANNCDKDPGTVVKDVAIDGSQTVTLTVDSSLDVNATEFQYDRPHYIRIAAIGAHYAIVPEHEEQVVDEEVMSKEWWRYFTGDIAYKTVTVPAQFTNDGQVNTSSAYNYSPVYKLEKGVITEVTDW